MSILSKREHFQNAPKGNPHPWSDVGKTLTTRDKQQNKHPLSPGFGILCPAGPDAAGVAGDEQGWSARRRRIADEKRLGTQGVRPGVF